MFQTSAFYVFRTIQIVNQVYWFRFDGNKVNFHFDNVSMISLSLQAYYMFQTSVFRTFEIKNHVDILWFDWNKVNLHSDNVYELSLSLEACLRTLKFQIHSICFK